ncbi:MAG TPA: rRNA maturation RNase YbeY [Burkholderiales bacterium]|nr:rRNA maturation RNase YbeY [Burkholderiales bacterium]
MKRGEARARLELAVQYAVPRAGLPARGSVAAWIGAALDERRARITVRFVGAAEGRRLNRDYRGRDYPTNVLTFVYDGAPRGALEGDIVLCAPVVAREARLHALDRRAHFAHLAVHGALHLQGYDHERAGAATRMEARERRIMERLGFGDPYGRHSG